MVNIQSSLDLQQQQHPRLLVMTHELNRFSRERLLVWKKDETMNVLLADGPITQSKSPTRKVCLPETGFIRLKNIIAPNGPIPVSKSTWWAGVKSKRFPQPIKLGPKITAWRVEDIRALIERPERRLDS